MKRSKPNFRLNIIATLFALAAPAAIAAPPEQAQPKNASASDDDKPKLRPVVHNVAQTDLQKDVAALKAEVNRLRAQNEMCQAGSRAAKAQTAGK